jgi:hypothetical protein
MNQQELMEYFKKTAGHGYKGKRVYLTKVR